MHNLLFLIILFVVAVLVGRLIHPGYALGFLLAATIMSVIWKKAAAGYRSAYYTKRKRRHIVTADGERLEIEYADDADLDVLTGNAHG